MKNKDRGFEVGEEEGKQITKDEPLLSETCSTQLICPQFPNIINSMQGLKNYFRITS